MVIKLIKLILEIIGWLAITLGTTLGTALIALAVYLVWTTDFIKIISFIFISIGFILGAVSATRIWIKHGTVEWLSGIRRIS